MSLAKSIGAGSFLIWGILHVWVLFDGLENYHNGVEAQWKALVGGARAPKSSFQFATDPSTAYAQSQLMINFTQDVGAFGVLGIILAYMIYFNKSSWLAYFIGIVVIGICDLSFLICLVFPGEVIELSFPVLLGPIIWFVAIIVTPFGLPPFKLEDHFKSD